MTAKDQLQAALKSAVNEYVIKAVIEEAENPTMADVPVLADRVRAILEGGWIAPN